MALTLVVTAQSGTSPIVRVIAAWQHSFISPQHHGMKSGSYWTCLSLPCMLELSSWLSLCVWIGICIPHADCWFLHIFSNKSLWLGKPLPTRHHHLHVASSPSLFGWWMCHAGHSRFVMVMLDVLTIKWMLIKLSIASCASEHDRTGEIPPKGDESDSAARRQERVHRMV